MMIGSMTRMMSMIMSIILIAIWASYWSMHVFLPVGPSTQRVGEHCMATTSAAASAHVIEMANKAYDEIMTKRLGWIAMMSKATAALDDPSDRKSSMFEA